MYKVMAKEKSNVELFQTAALITKMETMGDGGIRIVFDTQEISKEDEVAKLFRLKKGGIGWLLFKNKEIEMEDVPDYDPESFEEEKSPSKRLRNIMWVYHKEVKKGDKKDFDLFYRNYLERLIENYKSKLPPRSSEF